MCGAEGPACADQGARTPIGASGIYSLAPIRVLAPGFVHARPSSGPLFSVQVSNSGGHVKLTTKCMIVGGKGGVPEICLRVQS
jgi:hypothetical protein